MEIFWITIFFFFFARARICVCWSLKKGGVGAILEVAEQLVFFIPVHLWRPLLLFGVDFHLHLCRCRAQAHLGEGVLQSAALIIRQLQRRH